MADTPVSTVSPGIKTTEFILTIVVNLASVMATLTGLVPPTWGLLIMAGINAVYGILRTIVKINDPVFVPPVLPITS